jgi:uncharacterized protein involved in high-affinity Fe2+ transport
MKLSDMYQKIYLDRMYNQHKEFCGWSGVSYVIENEITYEDTQIRIMPVNADHDRWIGQIVRLRKPEGYYTTCTTLERVTTWASRLHSDKEIVLS